MGRVFSAEQVRTGAVPEHNAPVVAGALLLDALVDSPQEHGVPEEVASEITSALVFGSVALSEANPRVITRRSDVDINVNYTDRYAAARTTEGRARDDHINRTIRGVVRGIEARFNVPVGLFLQYEEHLNEWRPYPRHIRVGDDPFVYTWDEMLFRHMYRMQTMFPRWSRNDPITRERAEGYISPDQLAQGAMGYLKAKHDYLEGRLGTTPREVGPKPLEQSLGLPRAIARQATGLLEGAESAMRAIEDTPWALKWLVAHSSHTDGQRDAIHELISLDRDYAGLLEEVMGTRTEASFRAYEEWLSIIQPKAIRLAYLLCAHWTNIATDVYQTTRVSR